MPRKKLESTPELERIRAEIGAFLLRENMSQSSLAAGAGCRPYQVSRLLSGRVKKLTADVRGMCIFAKIEINESAEMSDNDKIRGALGRAWPGDPATASLLVAVIEALGPVLHEIATIKRGQGV